MKSGRQGDKVQLTLGDLYRRMSADFRAVRPDDHSACVMPMVVAFHDEEDKDTNWTVEPLTSFCPFCHSLSEMIVTEYSMRYQVRYFPQRARDHTPAPMLSGYFCAAD